MTIISSRSSTTLLPATTITWRCYRIPKFSLDGETLTEEGRCFDPELKETRERRGNITGTGSHDSSNVAMCSSDSISSSEIRRRLVFDLLSVTCFNCTTLSFHLKKKHYLFMLTLLHFSGNGAQWQNVWRHLSSVADFFYFVSPNSRDLILLRALHKWICSTADSNVL